MKKGYKGYNARQASRGTNINITADLALEFAQDSIDICR